MKNCWQNIYATYHPDREYFYTNVKKVLVAINVVAKLQVQCRNSTVNLAAAGGAVSPRTSEADHPTDGRSDDVTLADGVVQ